MNGMSGIYTKILMRKHFWMYGISRRRRMHPELIARMVPTLTWQQWEERTGQESLLPITIHPRSTAAFLSILWSSF